MFPLLRGIDYWEVIWKRLPNLGLNVLSAVYDMSAIVRFHCIRYFRETIYGTQKTSKLITETFKTLNAWNAVFMVDSFIAVKTTAIRSIILMYITVTRQYMETTAFVS